MGVGLTSIMTKQVLSLSNLKGKSLAVDANNYLYQFLSVIRTKDGTPLKDSKGNITSHLAGLMFRSTRLIHEFNVDLVFVFDGKPPLLKGEEIRKRREQREKALEEWQQALRKGDYIKAFSKAVMASRLTREMVGDAKRLLKLLGIPFVQAPSEAEAQAAYMAMRGDVWAASSKDYDCILFGAPRLLRFLTISGREYLPSKQKSRPIKPELIILQQFLLHHGITRRQLVDLAILVGTDFNKGIKGIGPKKALKLVKKYGNIENLPKEILPKVSLQFEKVRAIYLTPKTTKKYSLGYTPIKDGELVDFLCNQRDFAQNRVETAIARMEEAYKLRKQTKLEKWFTTSNL